MTELMQFLWVIGWLFTCGCIVGEDLDVKSLWSWAECIGYAVAAILLWPAFCGLAWWK